MSWKQPQRPPVKISQCYNDGMARVFSVSDAAAPGYQPIGELTPKIALPYEERRVGIKRYYDAQQNQIRVERVIRVQHVGGITSQDVVLDEKGRKYRIDLVQLVPDVSPVSDDLTLVDFEQIPRGRCYDLV